MKNGKPSVDEIKSLLSECERVYEPLQAKFVQADKFYELDFASSLNLPDEYGGQAIVLPTARDVVDTAVDHTDLYNSRVFVNKLGTGRAAEEYQQMMRKFYTGLIYRTNVEADISPWRVGGKHFWLYGLCCFRHTWEPDMWLDKPYQKTGESEEEYATKIEEWRADTHKSIPIKIEAINPHNVMPDPSYGGRLYVFEKHKKMVFDTQKMYPKWSNPKERKITDSAEYVIYFDGDYRCDLIDGEPVLPVGGGVAKHKYGFIPYTFIDSGLGNMSYDMDLKKRYVGILDYITDLLISESRDYSIADIVLSKTAFPWGVIKGANAARVQDIQQSFGTYTPLPDGVELIDMIPQQPPDALRTHLATTSDFIAAHAAPRSVRGLGEQGVRSGADRRLVISEASARYEYSKQAFAHGTAKVLMNCARLVKDVIPGDVRVWARTPTDEFDIEIKKEEMKEPFTCYVEFAPISEEDEYRRHDDLERLVASGIVTKKYARTHISNVDPISMEMEEEVEKLKNDPMIQQILSQYAASKTVQVLSVKEGAENPMPLAPANPMTGTPPMGPNGQPPVGRRLVPPIPNRAPLGSAGNMQNQMAQMRSQTSPNQQGMGGGGNR